MRQPLKEKIQNAITNVLLPENELGALIVGGRRRNRKKKNKNKNAARNRKNAKKAEGKSKRISLHKEDSGPESDPLIEDEAEDWKENQEDFDQGAEDTENVDPNKMPFDFFKKKSKKDKKEKKDKKDKHAKEEKSAEADNVQSADDTQAVTDSAPAQQQTFKQGTTLAEMASTVPKKPEPVKDPYEEAPDGGTVYPRYNDYQTSQPVAQEDGHRDEKPVDKDETELKKLDGKDPAVRSENSPLINKNEEMKESKLQDQQPGMLCCTIL